MTQTEQVIYWIQEHGEITPARLGGKIYKGRMFGSETSRVCRTLRADGYLESKKTGRFTSFYLAGDIRHRIEPKTPQIAKSSVRSDARSTVAELKRILDEHNAKKYEEEKLSTTQIDKLF